MRTISDFKKKLKVGTKLKSQRFVNMAGEWVEDKVFDVTREVSVVMSKQFALATMRNGKLVDSYVDYPKKDEFSIIDDNTVEIISDNCVKLIYTFIKKA